MHTESSSHLPMYIVGLEQEQRRAIVMAYVQLQRQEL